MFTKGQRVRIAFVGMPYRFVGDGPYFGTVSEVYPERDYSVLVQVDDAFMDRADYPLYTDGQYGTPFDYSFTADGKFISDDDHQSLFPVE